MAKKLKDTHIQTYRHTERLPLVVLSAALQQKTRADCIIYFFRHSKALVSDSEMRICKENLWKSVRSIFYVFTSFLAVSAFSLSLCFSVLVYTHLIDPCSILTGTNSKIFWLEWMHLYQGVHRISANLKKKGTKLKREDTPLAKLQAQGVGAVGRPIPPRFVSSPD